MSILRRIFIGSSCGRRALRFFREARKRLRFKKIFYYFLPSVVDRR
nr:MAG TPA: hypothetical protein [Caudoviricetes sp.]